MVTMPDPNPYETLLPTVLDRLIDAQSAGTRRQPGFPLERMVDTVQRDLEDLLNTRLTLNYLPDLYPELGNSLLAYGMPDLADLPAHTPEDLERIRQLFQEVVNRFEHRLSDVRVVLLDTAADQSTRSLKFRIEAHLRLDPAPPVAFETVLELSTGRARVRSAGG